MSRRLETAESETRFATTDDSPSSIHGSHEQEGDAISPSHYTTVIAGGRGHGGSPRHPGGFATPKRAFPTASRRIRLGHPYRVFRRREREGWNGLDGVRSRLSCRPLYEIRGRCQSPWLSLEPEPPPPDYIRAFWFAHAAVKKAYPGLGLGDYNVMVTVDDSEDQAVWAIRYRRRDNRSGLTVFLRDPIEIEVHSEGPSTGPSNPK